MRQHVRTSLMGLVKKWKHFHLYSEIESGNASCFKALGPGTRMELT